MLERIAFVKTGWSDEYSGGPVVGRHAHISEYQEAHERFNFLKAPDGKYYAYLPPIGRKSRPPQPREKHNWLIIFVSAQNGNGPLTVVGWYKNAFFELEYCERPEYALGQDFATDVNNNKYVYCISSGLALLIPTENRNILVPGDHFKRTPIVYVRGNGKNDKWRLELATLAEEIAAKKPSIKEDKKYSGFPDHEHRNAVENASIIAAIQYLEGTGNSYKITDKQSDKCGYDLLATRAREPKELHVEVKGTSLCDMRFYMTDNEKKYMHNPKWRLIIVTNALENPKVSLLNATEVEKKFQFKAFSWEAFPK